MQRALTCYVSASSRHTRDRGIPTEDMSVVLPLPGLTTVRTPRCSVPVQHTGKIMGQLSADVSHRTAAAGRGRTPQVCCVIDAGFPSKMPGCLRPHACAPCIPCGAQATHTRPIQHAECIWHGGTIARRGLSSSFSRNAPSKRHISTRAWQVCMCARRARGVLA